MRLVESKQILFFRIKHKLVDIIYLPVKWLRRRHWGVLQRTEHELTTFKRNKIIWTAFKQDQQIGPNLYIHGTWQFGEIDLVIKKLRPRYQLEDNKIIVNIGANIGTSAIHLAKICNCKILAIEPVPAIFEVLKKNVTQNGLSNRIQCCQCAVHSEATCVRILTPKINPGASEIYSENPTFTNCLDNPVIETDNIPALPLSAILESSGISPKDVVLVWSDAQGSEGHIIRTGTDLWKIGIPLVIELWPRGLKAQGEADIYSLIRSNFKAYCKIPTYKDTSTELIEMPVSALDETVVNYSDSKEDLDLLLLP
jgi:FkbM family methyltransferase